MMDEQQILQVILQNTFTKACYLKRLALLRGFLEKKFFQNSNVSLAEFLETTDVSSHEKNVITGWHNQFIDFFTAQNSYNLINNLKEKLNQFPVITLYLAVIPSEDEIDKIGLWWRVNYHGQVILDIHCHPNLIAGCSFVVNGKYRDYSVKTLLYQKRDLISQILDSYANSQ